MPNEARVPGAHLFLADEFFAGQTKTTLYVGDGKSPGDDRVTKKITGFTDSLQTYREDGTGSELPFETVDGGRVVRFWSDCHFFLINSDMDIETFLEYVIREKEILVGPPGYATVAIERFSLLEDFELGHLMLNNTSNCDHAKDESVGFY